jgi:hypothetical protein
MSRLRLLLSALTVVVLVSSCGVGTENTPEAQAVSTALVTCPPPQECASWIPEIETRRCLVDFAPRGTPCGTGGACDGRGVCVPPPPPPAPSNLAVIARTENGGTLTGPTITIAWSPSPGATSYRVTPVEVATSDWSPPFVWAGNFSFVVSGWPAPTTVPASAQPTYTLPDGAYDTGYCFRVAAVGPGGASPEAQICSVTLQSEEHIRLDLPRGGLGFYDIGVGPFDADLLEITIDAVGQSPGFTAAVVVPMSSLPVGVPPCQTDPYSYPNWFYMYAGSKVAYSEMTGYFHRYPLSIIGASNAFDYVAFSPIHFDPYWPITYPQWNVDVLMICPLNQVPYIKLTHKKNVH